MSLLFRWIYWNILELVHEKTFNMANIIHQLNKILKRSRFSIGRSIHIKNCQTFFSCSEIDEYQYSTYFKVSSLLKFLIWRCTNESKWNFPPKQCLFRTTFCILICIKKIWMDKIIYLISYCVMTSSKIYLHFGCLPCFSAQLANFLLDFDWDVQENAWRGQIKQSNTLDNCSSM